MYYRSPKSMASRAPGEVCPCALRGSVVRERSSGRSYPVRGDGRDGGAVGAVCSTCAEARSRSPDELSAAGFPGRNAALPRSARGSDGHPRSGRSLGPARSPSTRRERCRQGLSQGPGEIPRLQRAAGERVRLGDDHRDRPRRARSILCAAPSARSASRSGGTAAEWRRPSVFAPGGTPPCSSPRSMAQSVRRGRRPF